MGGIGVAEVAGKGMSGRGEAVLEVLAGLRNCVGDEVLMDIRASNQQRGGERDADGAADVAHEIEETAGVADLLVAQCAVGSGVDGHEDKAETESGDENGQQQGRWRDVERDGAEVERGESEGEETKGE